MAEKPLATSTPVEGAPMRPGTADVTRSPRRAADAETPSPSPRLLNSKPLLTRGNSTNSVLIQNTMAAPAVPQLLHSLAEYFHRYLREVNLDALSKMQARQGTANANPFFDAFDETLNPLSFKVHDCVHDDHVDHHAVEVWLKDVYRLGELQPECLVLSRAFFDRMRENIRDEFLFCTHTWRRTTLACLILASKIWEDMAVWNAGLETFLWHCWRSFLTLPLADFLGLIPRSDGKDLAKLEQVVLRALDFNIEFTAGQYATIYFDLRAIGQSEASSCDMAADDETLDEDLQRVLATRVSAFQEGLNNSPQVSAKK
jgi:Cyclin, N-terminal domain